MSGSWATVAAQQQEEPEVDRPAESVKVDGGTRCAVLDASAIIGGHSIRQYADKLFTTQEVSSEVQDRQSKQVLSSLPDGLLVQEPTEAAITAGKPINNSHRRSATRLIHCHPMISQSVKLDWNEHALFFAVTNFARAIGEIHSLSRADLHLIALAHSLHTSLHGEHSLHTEPAPARAVAKGKHVNGLLPGWGAAGGKWEEMDRLAEAEKAALERAQGKQLSARPHVLGSKSNSIVRYAIVLLSCRCLSQKRPINTRAICKFEAAFLSTALSMNYLRSAQRMRICGL